MSILYFKIWLRQEISIPCVVVRKGFRKSGSTSTFGRRKLIDDWRSPLQLTRIKKRGLSESLHVGWGTSNPSLNANTCCPALIITPLRCGVSRISIVSVDYSEDPLWAGIGAQMAAYWLPSACVVVGTQPIWSLSFISSQPQDGTEESISISHTTFLYIRIRICMVPVRY